jgi:hypothetical protein
MPTLTAQEIALILNPRAFGGLALEKFLYEEAPISKFIGNTYTLDEMQNMHWLQWNWKAKNPHLNFDKYFDDLVIKEVKGFYIPYKQSFACQTALELINTGLVQTTKTENSYCDFCPIGKTWCATIKQLMGIAAETGDVVKTIEYAGLMRDREWVLQECFDILR